MKKYLIAFTLLCASLITKAQVQVNNELKGLINQSFTYYPGVKEAQNQITVAEKRLDVVNTNLPTVDVNGSYEYVKPKITLPLEVDGEKRNFQFAPVNNFNGNVGAEYLLLDFGRLKANVDRAKSDIKYANDNLTSVQTQLASQVASVYYNIVYYQKAVAVEDSILNFLDSNRNITQKKLENGDAIKLDVLNIQSQIDAEQNLKEDFENSLQKQLTLLQYTTGNSTITDTTFSFNLTTQNVQDTFNAATATGPDFVLARDRVQQAQADLAITKITDRPSVSLNALAGVKNGYVPEVNDPRFNYQGGVSLRIPLYNPRTKKQVTVNEAQIQQNKLAQETLIVEHQKNTQLALTDIETNTDKLKNMQSQIATAMAAMQIASSRYLNGIGLNKDITDAAVNLERALLTNLRYEYQLAEAKVEYARVTGYKYW